jgi:UDP-N-acetylglucosamine 2-epimerase (non-hydrolysing)
MFDLRVAPMSRIVVAYGTRPERIKMQPVVDALRTRGFEVEEWCSGQSRDLLSDLDVQELKMWSSGHLTDGVGGLIALFGSRLRGWPADAVVVQGDTATAFACAQAAFLSGVPVAHVEAGMRTYERTPWPEETFRRQIALIANWHFCPSSIEASNLRDEYIDGDIRIVGNTVIDTLEPVPFNVLATLHRRENWGAPIADALTELAAFTESHANVRTAVVRHPNWAQHLTATPAESARFTLVAPMAHEQLLASIQAASVVVTDSGGLQEEAAHFGTPCLVYRDHTERVALQENDAITLCPPGTDALRMHLDRIWRQRNSYGAGNASSLIARILAGDLARA